VPNSCANSCGYIVTQCAKGNTILAHCTERVLNCTNKVFAYQTHCHRQTLATATLPAAKARGSLRKAASEDKPSLAHLA